MAPTPFYSPSPAWRGRGKGERAALGTHPALRDRGLNYAARHGGLTYGTNFTYRTPNPSITTGQRNMGARRWRPRPIRLHPEGAACRGEAAPRPYLLVACPHVIDGLGAH
jgi:hypothetical protein